MRILPIKKIEIKKEVAIETALPFLMIRHPLMRLL